MKSLKLLLLTLFILFVSVERSCFASDQGIVRVLFFYSEGCEYCERVHHVLDRLKIQYPDQLDISKQYDIADPVYGEVLDRLEASFGEGKLGNPPPIVFLGSRMLFGTDLADRLSREIIQEIQQGGTGWPVDLDSLILSIQSSSVTTEYRELPIKIAYFYSEGCKQCSRANGILARLKKTYSGVTVRSFSSRQNSELQEALAIQYGLSESKRLFTPSVFVGDSVLLGTDIFYARLVHIIEGNKASLIRAPWDISSKDITAAREVIQRRFQRFSISAIALAGLIDGINPCAFTTLIFFVAYLGFAGKSRREILAVGGAFTAAVFTTYLAVGLGFYQVLSFIQVSWLTSWLSYGVAVLTFVLGCLSVYDFILIKKGKVQKTQLQLPEAVKKRIHSVIRNRTRTRAFIWGALGTGFLVSLLELVCTGQVYLPTITAVIRIQGLRAHAVGFLVLYNILFILPLVTVFTIVSFGVSSEQISRFFQKEVGISKLLLAILFFGFTLILIFVH